MTAVRIGLVGAGGMGSALGANWRSGGSHVRTTLKGRSKRTAALARAAGLHVMPTIDDVVDVDVVVSIVPPGAAVSAAKDIAAAVERRGSNPLVADLNAVSPGTIEHICEVLGGAASSIVDGCVSGLPPEPGSGGTTIYLSGPEAGAVAAIASPWAEVVVLGDEVGMASAFKMCTASMYKGTNGLVMQALLTASHYGVLDAFVANVSRAWPNEVPRWPWHVALAATKSERFADEMREIADTQEQVGLTAELFHGMAEVFERVADSDLGQATPESVDKSIALADVIRRLR